MSSPCHPHHSLQQVLLGECLSGALYVDDFRRMMAEVGLSAWGICNSRRVEVDKPGLKQQLGDIKLYSLTVRAVKLPPGEADDLPEDYGQVSSEVTDAGSLLLLCFYIYEKH